MKKSGSRAGMTFALLSSASLLAALSPTGDIEDAQSKTGENPVVVKPDVFPAWDAQIESELGDANTLMKGYGGDSFDHESDSEPKNSVLVEREVPEIPNFDTPSVDGESLPDQDGVYSIDQGFDSEMRSYYRILGDMMYREDGESGIK